MADGKKYFDIRSNVDPIDNKLYMNLLKEMQKKILNQD
jgi:hypothetical protein